MMLISDVKLRGGGVRLDLECKSCGQEVTHISVEGAPSPESIKMMECPACGKAGG